MDEYVSPPFKIPASLLAETKKLGPVLNVGTETAKLGQDLISIFDAQKHKNLDYATISYLIFTQGFRTFSTIQTLCRSGCGSDSLSLCASLFENYVDLCYIGKAPYKHSRRYLQFELVDKYYQARRILKRRRLPKGWRKTYRGYEDTLKPQVAKVLRYFPKEKHKSGWSGKSLFARAMAVKHGLYYESLYWVFCAYKHTQPMVAGGIIQETDQNIDLIYSPSLRGVGDAAEYSTSYFLDLCQEFQGKHGLGKDSEIKTLSEELHDALQRVRNAHPGLFH